MSTLQKTQKVNNTQPYTNMHKSYKCRGMLGWVILRQNVLGTCCDQLKITINFINIKKPILLFKLSLNCMLIVYLVFAACKACYSSTHPAKPSVVLNANLFICDKEICTHFTEENKSRIICVWYLTVLSWIPGIYNLIEIYMFSRYKTNSWSFTSQLNQKAEMSQSITSSSLSC